MDSIEEKLQLFMEMYQEDRKRFLEAQLICSENTLANNCVVESRPTAQQNIVLPINDNESNLETFDDNEAGELESQGNGEVELSPDSDHTIETQGPDSRVLTPTLTPPSPSSCSNNELPQQLELFSLVTEKRPNNNVFRRLYSYNVWNGPVKRFFLIPKYLFFLNAQSFPSKV